MIDDSELLRRFVEQNSQPALTQLTARYVDVLYALAVRRLGGTSRADEVVQTVFVDLARKARALQHRPVLIGWLYAAVHLQASHVLREESRRRGRETEASRSNNTATHYSRG
jgi:DNA-directed RNA polymerase specialized sigma24 family protein